MRLNNVYCVILWCKLSSLSTVILQTAAATGSRSLVSEHYANKLHFLPLNDKFMV